MKLWIIAGHRCPGLSLNKIPLDSSFRLRAGIFGLRLFRSSDGRSFGDRVFSCHCFLRSNLGLASGGLRLVYLHSGIGGRNILAVC